MRHTKSAPTQSNTGGDTDRFKDSYPAALDKFLSDCSARFPHWNKYQHVLDETISGWGEHQGKR